MDNHSDRINDHVNEVTEEVKEEARKLSEEELEKVTGGARATSCRDAVVPQIE